MQPKKMHLLRVIFFCFKVVTVLFWILLQSVGRRGGRCPAVLSVPFPEEVLPVTTGIDSPSSTLNLDHIYL